MIGYDKYKSSEVDWIGKVPEHWYVKRIKRISEILRGASPRPIDDEKYFDENGLYSWVRISDVTASEMYLLQTEEKLSTLGSSLSVKIAANDIFVSIAGSVGKPIISKINACIHDGFVLLKSPKVNERFLYYLLITDGLYGGLGKLGTQLNLNIQIIGNVIIPLPTYDEQINIVNFLDNETQKIDKLVSNKKEQIEKLKELRQIEINNAVTKGLNPDVKLKATGIDWLGKIPEHWILKRLKNVARNVSEKSNEITEEDFIVALENIESETGRYLNTASEYESRGSLFKKGHILYNKLRPYLCKVYEAECDGISVGDIIIIECGKMLHPTFLKFRLFSEGFTSIVNSSTFGAKMPRTSWELISNLKIGIPSFDEQLQIADYLQRQTSKIDSLIKNIENQILKLQEHRKIVIYQAVTGKIKVTANECTTN